MNKLWISCWLSLAWLLPLPTQAGLILTTLFKFAGTNGTFPVGLVQTVDGSFLGTTLSGGPYANFGGGNGTVFKMATNGTVTMVFAFDGTKGSTPNGVLAGTDGNLYGTTELGGDNKCGNVYRLASDGTFTSLFSFNGTNGTEPAMLVRARDGNLYGTTPWGGIGYTGSLNSGFGTIFKIATNGTFTTLALFNGTNGSYPYGFPLVEGADGNLYGTTVTGGALFGPGTSGEGTIFKVSLHGELTTLFSFSETNGSGPLCLALGDNGDLYGTTQAGGINHLGTAFRLATNGVLSVLHQFTGGADGSSPWGNMIRGQNGNFFGTTGSGALGQGTVFEITSQGILTTLYSFTGGGNGGTPWWLTQGGDGLLYGTTQVGSTLFRLAAPAGPILPAQTDRGLTDLSTLSVTNTATDLDPAASILSYALINPPAGAQIDSNGVITWLPTLSQSPSVNVLTTVVTDDGIPPLTATNSFTVTVTGLYDGIDLMNPAQALADPDGDGVANLMEFALGTDPRKGSDGGEGLLISTVQDSGRRYLSIQFKHRTNAGGLTLQYIPEVSGDRQTWSADPANIFQVGVSPLDAQFDWVSVRDQTPTTAATPRFIRLRVVEN